MNKSNYYKILTVFAMTLLLGFTANAQSSWWLPAAGVVGPVVDVPDGDPAPVGYFLASNQACVDSVIAADPFCLDTQWDDLCTAAYLACALDTCIGNIFLPDSLTSGPAVLVCAGDTVPNGYVYAESQICAAEVIINDAFCLFTSWDGLCQDAYQNCFDVGAGIVNGCTDPSACNYDPNANNDDGSCFYPNVFIPAKGVFGPAILDTCGGFNPPPPGYVFADQACALQVIANDPFCLNVAWDGLCQTAYYQCVLGLCPGAQVYLPDSVSAGPAIIFCPGDTTDLTGYSLADNQECALTIITNDPFCLDTSWDQICQDAYDECLCALYELAPTDLTKSFDPVNGVRDRVQVKWFKAVPQVRYTDKDAAMCDIEFWPKRNLDPETGNPIGPAIVNPDTTLIENAKKTYGDGSPRSIFKWPVKFRADGANNNKRAEPNIRYEWRVRCECGHDGFGPESPWSDVKIFNTPDFDPATGIFEEPAVPGNATKSLANQMDVALYPNPSDGSGFNLQFSATSDVPYIVEVVDMTGRVIYSQQVNVDKNQTVNLNFGDSQLQNGMYMLNLLQGDVQSTLRFVVK